MAWWIWILIGLVLLLIEAIAPGGFVALFFGAAAVVVGLLGLFGAGGPAWFQWLLCSFLALSLLFTLRKKLLSGAALAAKQPIDQAAGD